MKKLLVVLMAAMMVLSLAAVSMAAATVEGDFRAEWKSAEDVDDGDFGFSKNDLRLNFKGKVSDSVDAYMIIANENGGFKSKEYAVTLNQDWGKVQAGNWDYKLLPDRVILKLHNINCINAGGSGMQWLFDIPVGDAFTFGLWMIPDLREDKMDMDVKLAYKGDGFGAELHYGLPAADVGNYYSFSAYYKVNDNIKVFAEAINADDDYMAVLSDPWNDNMAAAVGAVFSNIGGSKLTASVETAVVGDAGADEFAPMAVQLKYAFNNKVSLEFEYYNYDKNDEETIMVIRPRVKF